MNKIIKSVISSVAIYVLIYFMAAFILWEMDPSLWDGSVRFVVLLIGTTFSAASTAAIVTQVNQEQLWKKGNRSPILEELLRESPKDIEERVKKLSEVIMATNENKEVRKPPIGLRPKWFIDEKRLAEIGGAIQRYMNHPKELPLEWIEEYNEIVERIEARQ